MLEWGKSFIFLFVDKFMILNELLPEGIILSDQPFKDFQARFITVPFERRLCAQTQDLQIF